jgi:hypothetical protein
MTQHALVRSICKEYTKLWPAGSKQQRELKKRALIISFMALNGYRGRKKADFYFEPFARRITLDIVASATAPASGPKLLVAPPTVMFHQKERRYKMSDSPKSILPSLSNVVRFTAERA